MKHRKESLLCTNEHCQSDERENHQETQEQPEDGHHEASDIAQTWNETLADQSNRSTAVHVTELAVFI